MQQLYRLDDWRSRLAAEMDRQRRDPFTWGRHDCAIGFAAGIVEALTGIDLAQDYRGRYRSQAGALRLLRDSGAADLGDFAAQMLSEIHPSRAGVGDIGIIVAPGVIGQAFCMFDASGIVVMTEAGHGRRSREDAIRAFRVGE